MAGKEGWHDAMMERRPMVARLLLRHQKPGAIHRALNEIGQDVSYETVRRDIAAQEREWHLELVVEPLAMKSRELAEINEAMAECWNQYTRSGAQHWLTELRLWMERKAKLMGLDSVQVIRAEVSGLDGGPVQTQVGIEVLFGDPVARRLIDALAEHLESESGSDGP